MNHIWFIADTHFGHINILKYEPIARPFVSIEEMNEVMIERWNSVVRPNDTVYHLGDFCFRRDNISVAARLNGKKRLVLGNHDCYGIQEYLPYFEKVYGSLQYKHCFLTHVPVHPNCLNENHVLNVHGHLHSKKVGYDMTRFSSDCTEVKFHEDERYLNVSCEQNNLMPISFDVIKQRLDEL